MGADNLITLTINDKQVQIKCDEQRNLLDVLREDFHLLSPKNGCSPQGSCGCCTVLIDDKPLTSCTQKIDKLDGKNIQTLEGISREQRVNLSNAFTHAGGMQCGFCTPGIAVRTHWLLQNSENPTREDMAKALNNHICRCTGYKKIIDSMELAAQAYHGKKIEMDENPSGRIGTNLDRFMGSDHVLGSKNFVDDITMSGMIFGAVLFSRHPRAKVLSINTGKAAQLPGVIKIITAKDVPGQRFQGLIEKDWPLFVAEGETTSYIGDVIAAVAAESNLIARQAVEMIEVQYEILKPVTYPEKAIESSSPAVHPNLEKFSKTNILSKSVIKRGNADSMFAKAAHIVEETFTTQMIEHAFLEPESAIAYPEGNEWHVLSQGQGVYDDQIQIASILGIGKEKLNVELVSNGGAFGGKEDLSIQGHVALLAFLTRKPVKMTLSREESIRMHPKRHPIKMAYKIACDADGYLLAVKARMIGDTGAYASVGAKVLERAAGHATGPYSVPNVDVESIAAYTNNLPCGAMRGFGANQASFGIESAMDMLAEKVGIDGWEIRYKNALDVGDAWCSGQLMTESVGIKKTLEAVKEKYKSAKIAGIACGIKNVGIGNGMPEYGRACLHVENPEKIIIYNGFTEMGQGLYTTLIQVACEITGLPPRIFDVRVETDKNVETGMTTASRATVLGGRAVILAAEKLKAELDKGKSIKDLVDREFYGEVIIDYTSKLGADVKNPITHMTFGFATQVAILNDEGRLVKFIACHDVGKAINPKMVEGQIEGSVHMGIGYALTEDLPLTDGVPDSFSLRSLGIIRAKDMPEIETIIVEQYEPEGPFGAKGVGEIGLVPTAGAVANALYAFDGIRRTSLPMKESPAGYFARGKKPPQ